MQTAMPIKLNHTIVYGKWTQKEHRKIQCNLEMWKVIHLCCLPKTLMIHDLSEFMSLQENLDFFSASYSLFLKMGLYYVYVYYVYINVASFFVHQV